MPNNREFRLFGIKHNKFSKAVLYFLKLALSAYILWRIAGKIDFGSALQGMLSLPLGLVILLICLSAVRHIAQYHNWLFALSINPAFTKHKREVLQSYLIGLPLRFAVPGGHASIGKIFFISNSSRSASFWSTALERGFMTWGTWTFAALAAVIYYPQIPLWLRVLAVFFCAALPVILYKLLSIKANWRHLQTPYTKQAPRMMGMQISSNLITYLQYWLILSSVLNIGWWQSAIRMALTQFSNSIPITVAGLGLRESFAIHFLKTAGISAEQAVSATLSLFFIQDVLPALVGTWFLIKAKKV